MNIIIHDNIWYKIGGRGFFCSGMLSRVLEGKCGINWLLSKNFTIPTEWVNLTSSEYGCSLAREITALYNSTIDQCLVDLFWSIISLHEQQMLLLAGLTCASFVMGTMLWCLNAHHESNPETKAPVAKVEAKAIPRRQSARLQAKRV